MPDQKETLVLTVEQRRQIDRCRYTACILEGGVFVDMLDRSTVPDENVLAFILESGSWSIPSLNAEQRKVLEGRLEDPEQGKALSDVELLEQALERLSSKA